MMKKKILSQDSHTGIIKPKVSLVSYSRNPISTMFSVWHGSRFKDTYNTDILELILNEEDLPKEVQDISNKLAKQYEKESGREAILDTVVRNLDIDVPVSESIMFTFQIDDATVTWREQLIRQKFVGMWTQSSRTMDMSTMDVSMSESIELLGGEEAVAIYKNLSDTIRKSYRELIKLGVPQEDIRLQPLNSTHRVYFWVSLRTLVGIIKKRCSWIAQASVWTPIIKGILSELDSIGLLEYIRSALIYNGATISYDESNKPYISDYNFILDAEARMRGDDPLPIDPLYLAYTNKDMPEHTDLDFYDYMKSQYIEIWGDEYLEILGWDRTNPSKLGYYDRPSRRGIK